MKRKGFTMVELLITIVILGLLTVMTYAGYSTYQKWARESSYDTMAHSAMQAVEDYVMDHSSIVKAADTKKEGGITYYVPKANAQTLSFEELEQYGYFTTPIDPLDKGNVCTGTVTVAYIPGKVEGAINQYVYVVDECCVEQSKRYVYSYKKVGSKYEPYQPVTIIDECGLNEPEPEPEPSKVPEWEEPEVPE